MLLNNKATITMLFTSVFTALVTVAVAMPTGPVAVRSADMGTPAQLGARTEGIYDSNTRMQTPQTPHPLIKWPPYFQSTAGGGWVDSFTEGEARSIS